MKKKVLFIYNPNAGRGKIRTKLSQILEIFSKTNCELVVYPTKQRMDAREKVMEYVTNEECNAIICSGGDGTLNEVVGGLMQCNYTVPVGYIPSGTTNDFGYSLRIPKDMIKAAEVIVRGATMLCDVGSINENYFTYTAAFGLFADVSYDTPQNVKNILGRMAYILRGVTSLHGVKSIHLKVEHDDEVVEDDFLVGMIANSNSVAGFRGITGKKVQLDDGLFELIMIRQPHNLLEISNIINDLLHNDLSSKYFYYRRVSEVKVTSDIDMPWSLDGEFGGTTRIANLVVHKKAIPYICNRTSKRKN
ncbi:MAG: YegS/Rv2252/BmrU family lipid kinase [Clostridiales bacterium]|nr:YegS/Rv2252/BmrU family lipid kinase [Clostridiales bacterium]